MLPDKTYTLKFIRCDRPETETCVYKDAHMAWEGFRMFAEPVSAEMYTRIELTEFDWDTRVERLLSALEFTAPETEQDEDEDDPWDDYEEEYTPSCTAGDYSPSNPWDAPGMSIRDFI